MATATVAIIMNGASFVGKLGRLWAAVSAAALLLSRVNISAGIINIAA